MTRTARLQFTLTFVDPDLSSVFFAPTAVLNGGTATGTVTLTGTTNSPIVVSLWTSSADAYLPSRSVTIPAGASSATFTIQGNLQTITPATVTINAVRGTVVRQTTLTVNLPWLTTFTVSPQSLVGGNNATGAGTINGPPPANGSYNVTFTSTNTSLVATPKAINYSGTTSGQTTVLTNPVVSQTPVVVTAHDPTGINLSQTLTLLPAPVTLSAFTVNPTSVIGT